MGESSASWMSLLLAYSHTAMEDLYQIGTLAEGSIDNRCTSSRYKHKIAVTVPEETMTSTNLREIRLRVNSGKETTTSLVAELRKLQDRVQVLEAAQVEFQKRMKCLENDVEEMAARVDPDL